MEFIARLPDCDGQASDAASAYTQVKLEDAARLLIIPKSECPDVWIRLPRHEWPKSWAHIEDPVVPLQRIFFGHPLAGFLCSIGTWMRKSTKIGNVCSFIEHKVSF